MSMQGKVITITGVVSGIGLATAKLLSSRGATVCIGDIDPRAIEDAKAHFSSSDLPGTQYKLTQLDVTSRSDVEAWLDAIITQHGHLDGGANCAGVIGKRHGETMLVDLEDEEWQRIIGINLTGLMYCLRGELRKVVEGGSIVNVSSIQGAMAKEVGYRNVRVKAIAPGSIDTPLLRRAQEVNPNEGLQNPTAIKRVGMPEEMAGIIAFLLGLESTYVTGSVYGGDCGWNC